MGNKKKADIEKLVELVPEDKRMIAERLAAELSFMDETLEQLKGEVRKRGAVDEFKQGKQEFLRESPALRRITPQFSVTACCLSSWQTCCLSRRRTAQRQPCWTS